MSVAIKGMDVPEGCDHDYKSCDLKICSCIGNKYQCLLTKKFFRMGTYRKNRHPNCPLMEVREVEE